MSRRTVRGIRLDEKQFAKMHPASSGEWSPGMMMISMEQSAMVLPTRDLIDRVVGIKSVPRGVRNI